MKTFSVCEYPTYVEAREKTTKKDWTGSNSILVHQLKNSTEWAIGFSKDFGLVLWKELSKFFFPGLFVRRH